MNHFNLLTCKQVGRSHIKTNKPCQDDCKAEHLNDVNVIVLSDGCGSSKHSEYGSDLITEVLIKKFTEEFDDLYEKDEENLKIEINNYVYSKAEEFVKNKGWNIKDINATYLFAAEKNSRWIIGRLGDGAIVLINKDKNTKLITEPKDDNVEFTTYFTSSNAIQQMELHKLFSRGIDSVVMMSDGPKACLISDDNEVNINVFSIAKLNKGKDRENVNFQIASFLDQIVNRNGENPIDDDCSLAVMSLNNFERKYFVHDFISQYAIQEIKKASFMLDKVNELSQGELIDKINNRHTLNMKECIPKIIEISKNFSGRESKKYFMKKYDIQLDTYRSIIKICKDAKLLKEAKGVIEDYNE